MGRDVPAISSMHPAVAKAMKLHVFFHTPMVSVAIPASPKPMVRK